MLSKVAALVLFALSLQAEPLHFPVAEPPPVSQFANGNSLGVPSIAQKTNSWCWAASSEMILDFFRKNISQCELVSDLYFPNTRYCCQSPTPQECIKGGWPRLDFYGVRYSTTSNSAVSWQQIKNDIDRGAPLLASFKLASGVGHMVTVVGYGIGAQGNRLVEIINPCDRASANGCITARHYIDYDRVYVPGLPPYNLHWNDYYGLY